MTLHDLISNLNRIEYLELCAKFEINGDSAQEMSWFVAEYNNDWEWVQAWLEEFRKGEEE